MLKEKNGFSMIEVLFASTLFFQAFLLFIPIHTNIQASTEILAEKRWAAMKLHDELQEVIHTGTRAFPNHVEIKENHKTYHFEILKKDNFLKGCVKWKNAKEQDEIICLHGQTKQ